MLISPFEVLYNLGRNFERAVDSLKLAIATKPDVSRSIDLPYSFLLPCRIPDYGIDWERHLPMEIEHPKLSLLTGWRNFEMHDYLIF